MVLNIDSLEKQLAGSGTPYPPHPQKPPLYARAKFNSLENIIVSLIRFDALLVLNWGCVGQKSVCEGKVEINIPFPMLLKTLFFHRLVCERLWHLNTNISSQYDKSFHNEPTKRLYYHDSN